MTTPADDPTALFVEGEGTYTPTRVATGPWRPDAMHGGPPCALVGLLAEGERRPEELVARVQVDLERPVPMAPLAVTVSTERISRRVRRLGVELWCSDQRAVSARVLLLHQDPLPVAVTAAPATTPADGTPVDWLDMYPGDSFVRQAVEHRLVEGDYRLPGPAAAWLRLGVPVVADRPTTPLMQLLGLADFGSPLSMPAVGPGKALINLDVNVTLFRAPAGSWFHLDASAQLGPDGIGLATTRVSDSTGLVGVVVQSQLVRAFEGWP
jgi:hypothetical protein